MSRVLIVGGGPAGLTAARLLASRAEVVVLDREAQPGGVPRYTDHQGFGAVDLHRLLRGPAYADTLARLAREAGAIIRSEAMATDWAGERALNVTSPSGREVVEADAVILATGVRERPLPARLVPSDRGEGVLTTGQLQRMVLAGQRVGTRAVVIGSELVSWSAVRTLRHAGCEIVCVLEPGPHAALRGPAAHVAPRALRTCLVSNHHLVRVVGRPRTSAVEVEDTRTGKRAAIACDTVVLTGCWVPDHELARQAGVRLDAATKRPVTGPGLATSVPGVYAIGNLAHRVRSAGFAARDGLRVARALAGALGGGA